MAPTTLTMLNGNFANSQVSRFGNNGDLINYNAIVNKSILANMENGNLTNEANIINQGKKKAGELTYKLAYFSNSGYINNKGYIVNKKDFLKYSK